MYFPSERLIAAMENVRLVPHSWQRVAVEPTRVPQAGHKLGRRCFSCEWNVEEKLSRNLSIFKRQRSGSGNGFLAATLPRSYNTEKLRNGTQGTNAEETLVYQLLGQLLVPSNSKRAMGMFGGVLFAFFLAGCAARRPVTSPPATTPEQGAPPVTEPTRSTTAPRAAPPSAVPGEYTEEGVASWYGAPFNGRRTSNGEIYDMHQLTAAHRTLPFNAVVRVTNLTNGKEVNVRINDRGPFVANRVIDLSYSAAEAIGMVGPGTAEVRLDVVAGPDPNVGFFGVQVGAFQVEENAERLRQQLSARYTPVTIAEFDSPNGVYYRVRAGRLPSEAAAQELATQIQQQENTVALVVRLDN